jgi:outer membrane protein OmpA-like peptidoglycan-associated protein
MRSRGDGPDARRYIRSVGTIIAMIHHYVSATGARYRGGGTAVRIQQISLLGTLVALALAAATAAMAQSGVTQMSGKPTADELIRALTAKPGTSRGIVVKNSNPTATPAASAPAVALDVKFALNSAVLSDEAKDLIKQVALAINSDQLGRARFLLEGHTDTTGTPAYNLSLSKQRAAAVREALIKDYGVKSARLRTLGRGQDNLLDPANPQSPVNRRVLIVNLGE